VSRAAGHNDDFRGPGHLHVGILAFEVDSDGIAGAITPPKRSYDHEYGLE
jgi:hypothetical protein